jgi:hypothetical protein
MDKLKKIGSVIALCMLTVLAQAQDKTAEPADFMRSNGKIYVVVAVVVTIVVGLFIYLLNLDRKIGKMERREA